MTASATPPPAGPATGGPSRALPAQGGAQTTLTNNAGQTVQGQPQGMPQPAGTLMGRGGAQTALTGKAGPTSSLSQAGNTGGANLVDMSNPTVGPGGIPLKGQYANPVFQQQQQTRQQQEGLLSRIQGDMNGGAPSLAELLLRKGSDENVANAQALAASGGPGNAAAGARQAALSAARAGQDLAGQVGALRAQEYAQARQEATGLANSLRVQDLQATGMSYDNAVKQAQLEADQAKTQLGADVQMAGVNAQREQGLLDLGLRSQALSQDERDHLADLLVQKYGIDKNVAVQMAGQPNAMDYIIKGAATGGAVGGVPGAIAGGVGGWLYGQGTKP